MPFGYKLTGSYHKNNPFSIGDRIKWKSTGEVMTVGDDWEELQRWGSDEHHIVTTSGRVLRVTEVEHTHE